MMKTYIELEKHIKYIELQKHIEMWVFCQILTRLPVLFIEKTRNYIT